MAKEFTPKRSSHVKKGHEISMDDRIWAHIQEIADREYGGSCSKALASLVVYDWMIELHKRKNGKKHSHWLSSPLVMNVGELEPVLQRLTSGDSEAVGEYVEVRIAEMAKRIRGDLPKAD
jgi:hypothetical protein